MAEILSLGRFLSSFEINLSMSQWTRVHSVCLVLAGVVIVGLLFGGILLVYLTYPDDQGSITNAALVGCTNCIGSKPTISIGPKTEERYIVEFMTTTPSGSYSLYFSPKGDVVLLGPVSISSASTLSSFEVQYVVFTYSFQDGTPVWFTGPQGNLTGSVQTSKFGGTDYFSSGHYGASIIEVQGAGNYTLHALNSLAENSNATLVMGPSTVTFTKPYFYAGTLALSAGTIALVTTGILIRKLRTRTQAVETAKPSYMR